MQNIRYNPLFGTGDASSDAVNPVFGVARSNPLYGLHARANEDGLDPEKKEPESLPVPDQIALLGYTQTWHAVVFTAGIAYDKADLFFSEVEGTNPTVQSEILEDLQAIFTAQQDGDMQQVQLLTEAAALRLRTEFDEFIRLEQAHRDSTSSTFPSAEEIAEQAKKEDASSTIEMPEVIIQGQTPFQEFITAQGLEPSFNMMNILLGGEGKHLSPEQFNLAYDLQIPELSTLVEGLEVVMESEAVAFGDILSGEADISEAGARLQGMGIAMGAAKAILNQFLGAATTDQGPFRDLPPHHSASWQEPNAWVGEPNHDYGEYQGIAAAGYGTAAPVDFQGKLEAAWDVIAGHGISADEYEAMSTADKQVILEHAEAYERSGGRDAYAAEQMINAAFVGLSDEAIEEVFDVPLNTTTMDRVEVLRDGFSRAFPFYDIVDQPIYELLQTTIGEIERASGIPVTAERLAKGLSAFRNIGFTSYRPDILVSVLANVCAKFANADDLIMGVLSSDAFCSDERIANTQKQFGLAAAAKFDDFCNLAITGRMVEIELNNFDIAQMLDINGSDLDKLVIEQLNSQVAPNPEPKQLVDDVRRVLAPEVVSPVSRTVVPRTDSKVANQLGGAGSKDPSKIAAIATIGITAVALGFLANKLRKL